jgi:hypothetical protein
LSLEALFSRQAFAHISSSPGAATARCHRLVRKDRGGWYLPARGAVSPAAWLLRDRTVHSSQDLVHWTFRNRVIQLCRPRGIRTRVGVAISGKVDGDYRYLKSFRPLGHESRDIGQFIDDDGTAYLIFEDRPFGFRIATLSDDYLSVEREVCLIPLHWEGGAVVHYEGLYYITQLARRSRAGTQTRTSTSPPSLFRDPGPIPKTLLLLRQEHTVLSPACC